MSGSVGQQGTHESYKHSALSAPFERDRYLIIHTCHPSSRSIAILCHNPSPSKISISPHPVSISINWCSKSRCHYAFCHIGDALNCNNLILPTTAQYWPFFWKPFTLILFGGAILMLTFICYQCISCRPLKSTLVPIFWQTRSAAIEYARSIVQFKKGWNNIHSPTAR